MAQIEVANTLVSYIRKSPKNPTRTILFLHGWSGSKDVWNTNIEALSRYFDCVAVDLPGFGDSPELTRPWDIDDYVNLVNEVIDHLSLDSVVIVGKSFGGRIAIKLGAQESSKISKLILVAAAGVEEKSIITKLAILLSKFFKLLRLDKIVLNAYRHNESDFKWSLRKSVTNTKLDVIAKHIQLPTLIIWGEEDKVLPKKYGLKLARLINRSVLVYIKGGHSAHKDNPQKFNETIVTFLSSDKP